MLGVQFTGPATVSNPEQASPSDPHAPWQEEQPDCTHQHRATPCNEVCEHMDDSSAEEDGGGEATRHVRVVELGEAEGRFTQLAVLFLRVRQPFHEALLMDKLDAPTTLARVEQGLISGSFAAAYPACVRFVGVLVVGLCVRRIRGVVHEIGPGGARQGLIGSGSPGLVLHSEIEDRSEGIGFVGAGASREGAWVYVDSIGS